MAKRSRGAVRPGQTRPTRRPQQRPVTRAGALDPLTSSTPGPIGAEIGDVDADVAIPMVARSAGRPGRDRSAVAEAAAPGRVRTVQTSSLLAARAAEEYSYVVRDVRRIGLVGGSLFLVLIALYILIEVLHLFAI